MKLGSPTTSQSHLPRLPQGDTGAKTPRSHRSKKQGGVTPPALTLRKISVSAPDEGSPRTEADAGVSTTPRRDAIALVRKGFDTPIRKMAPVDLQTLKDAVDLLLLDGPSNTANPQDSADAAPDPTYLRFLRKQIAAVENVGKKPRKETDVEKALRSLMEARPESVLKASLSEVDTLLSHVSLVLPLAREPELLLRLKFMSQALMDRTLTRAAAVIQAAADAEDTADQANDTDLDARRAAVANKHAKRDAASAQKVSARAVHVLDAVSAACAKAQGQVQLHQAH